jgi:hypothetical protein
VANYNVDIDVAVRGYNRVEQTLKKVDRLIGTPRTLEISPFINVRKFRREQQKIIREARRAGVEAAVAFQEAFEREARIARQVAGAGSRALPGTTGPFGLLPATAVGQFQRAANAAKAIDAAFANAKRSIDSITNRLALPPGGGGIAGLLPPAGGTGQRGGDSSIIPFTGIPRNNLGDPNQYRRPIGPRRAPFFSRLSQEQRSAAITGGAFPLLFGGGFGQAAGGAIGGAISGKMFGGLTVGLQVAGMAVDSFVGSTIKFSSTLSETDTALQSMTERSLFSTKATQQRAEELQALGETQELSKLLTAELASTIGTDGVKAFKDLGDESSEFNTLVNRLFISLQALIAGPLAGFLSLVNSVLGRDISEQTIRNLKGSLQTPEGVAAFDKRVRELVGTEAITRTLGQGEFETKEVLKTASLEQLGTLRREAIEGKFGETDLLANLIDPSKPTPKKTGKTEAERLAERVERSRQIANQVEREAANIREISGFKDRIAAAELIGDKQSANRIRVEMELEEIENRRVEAIEKINNLELPETAKQLRRQGVENRALAQQDEARAEGARRYAEIIQDEQNEALRDQADILKKNFDLQKEELEKAQALAKGLTDIVRDGFVDGIKAATDETRSLSEALANMLDRLADKFLNLAANLAFYGNPQGDLKQGAGIVGSLLGSVSSIFNPVSSLIGAGQRYGGMSPTKFIQMGGPPALPPLPGKALGGAVGAGRPYMVGERGPELFVPGAQGNIVPNNAMGGSNIVVNVDASGSSVEGDSDQAAQLGKMLGAAVQAELVKQKRPGGLLAS